MIFDKGGVAVEDDEEMHEVILVHNLVLCQLCNCIIVKDVGAKVDKELFHFVLEVVFGYLIPDLFEFLAVGLVVDACVSEKHPNAVQSSRICENIAGVFFYPSQCVHNLLSKHIVALPF